MADRFSTSEQGKNLFADNSFGKLLRKLTEATEQPCT
jgi:hypothetical protein